LLDGEPLGGDADAPVIPAEDHLVALVEAESPPQLDGDDDAPGVGDLAPEELFHAATLSMNCLSIRQCQFELAVATPILRPMPDTRPARGAERSGGPCPMRK